MSRLSDTALRRFGYTLIVASGAFGITAVVLGFELTGQWLMAAGTLILVGAFVTTTTLAIHAQPRNGAVWALTGAMLLGLSGVFGSALAAFRTGLPIDAIEGGLVPGSPRDYDVLSALGISVSNWAWIPSVFSIATLLLILFPSGTAPSRRWRIAAWVAAACIAALSLQGLLVLAPWVDTTYAEVLAKGDGGTMAPPVGLSMLPLLAIALAAVIHLVVRYRRSSGDERLQYRWVTWALGLYVVLGVFGFEAVSALGGVGGLLNTILLANIPISIGIAITKYRLYDIDLVISRSVVFVVLVGFITAVYSGLVVGVGSLVGGSSVGWSIGATALVAVMFEPVRDRVQRWVNRLVYGRRATPYEVLSDLTGRLAATERGEGLLDRMAVRLAEGTGADRAVVWTTGGSLFQPAASNPGTNLPTGPVHDRGALPGTVVPIIHDNEILGALTVETRRGDTLTPTELRLVEDLAGSAGLLMRRVRLDTELEQKAHELEESRRRLVDAQDVERRRLERELNEGPQQRVIALKLQLGLAAQLAREEGADTIVTLIDQMTTETQDAIDQITALANGIYPPVLEAEGLNAAITALAKQAPVDVRVNLDVSARYPLPVEGAVYFCISEALTNATKHGQPPITIAVSDQPDTLSLTVTDTGPGFDTNTITRGAGLNNMADRLDALNGSITINSTPGQPTTITGHIPQTASLEVPA